MNTEKKMNINDFIQILNNGLIEHSAHLSHKNGSSYFRIGNLRIRIADHSKPEGYEMMGMIDFRSFEDREWEQKINY